MRISKTEGMEPGKISDKLGLRLRSRMLRAGPGAVVVARQNSRALITLLVVLLFGASSCSRSEANQYDPGEANVLVVSAFAAKDGECGTTHNFTSIIFFPADRANVEACVVAVLDTSCTSWSVTNPTPSVCSFIGVQFES